MPAGVSAKTHRGCVLERSAIGGPRRLARRSRDRRSRPAPRLAAELSAIPPGARDEAAVKRADLQQRHDFTVRNFEEIQRTIRYACETPVALDARLGAWARALQEAAAE